MSCSKPQNKLLVRFGILLTSQANFTWTPINDTCQVHLCPTLSIPHSTSQATDRTLGQRPLVTCNSGFFVSTEEDATDKFYAR